MKLNLIMTGYECTSQLENVFCRKCPYSKKIDKKDTKIYSTPRNIFKSFFSAEIYKTETELIWVDTSHASRSMC